MNSKEFRIYDNSRRVRKAIRDADRPDAFLAEMDRLHRIQQACNIVAIICIALVIVAMMAAMYWRAAR